MAKSRLQISTKCALAIRGCIDDSLYVFGIINKNTGKIAVHGQCSNLDDHISLSFTIDGKTQESYDGQCDGFSHFTETMAIKYGFHFVYFQKIISLQAIIDTPDITSFNLDTGLNEFKVNNPYDGSDRDVRRGVTQVVESCRRSLTDTTIRISDVMEKGKARVIDIKSYHFTNKYGNVSFTDESKILIQNLFVSLFS